MDIKKGEIQALVLKALVKNNGTANTKEVEKLTGLRVFQIHGATRHLLRRGLILKKRGIKPHGMYDICQFSIRPTRIIRANEIINIFFGENVN